MTAQGTARALAEVAFALARRFADGATLWCIGPDQPQHARHLAVEFMHPVVVGARALPAVAVVDVGGAASVADVRGRPGDVLAVFGDPDDAGLGPVLGRARDRGLSTVLFAGPGSTGPVEVDHVVAHDPDGGPLRSYHLLWELTHVVFEHPGLLAVGGPDPSTAPAEQEATAFLYPFLDATEDDPEHLLQDLTASASAKIAASAALRETVVTGWRVQIEAAATAMADRFRHGGRLLSFGNGGSAADADGIARLFRDPDHGAAVAADSLSDDAALLSALANDVGVEVVFARQVAAFARAADVAFGLSTSGGSANVLRAFDEARRRGLLTVGICGYDGGPMARSGALDHCIVIGSDSVHRIQEAQDAVVHALLSGVRAALAGETP